MRTFLDCLVCFVRQSLEAVRMTTDDPEIHERVMRRVLLETSRLRFDESPAAMGATIHRIIREVTGEDDPYRRIKRESNRLALALYPRLRARVKSSDDPFATALRFAVAANVIDFGVSHDVDLQEIAGRIEEAADAGLDEAEIEALRRAVEAADDILYIGDNAGEIALDRLFIEQMPAEKVTFAVRGRPVINDATREDAEAVGLADRVEVIDNGDDAPGTILERCSAQFRRRFEAASLVIAKGQGNYETLSDVGREIFFILKAKCEVVARDLGCEVGAMIIRRKPEAAEPAGRVALGGGTPSA